jgi:hypothetical protein
MVVKHDHQPTEHWKMDGQFQTRYHRKNWSSVCLFNCDHPANKALTVDLVNSAPGRDLHAFSWLADDLIGELPPEWNWLVGHSAPMRIPPSSTSRTGFRPCPAMKTALSLTNGAKN